MSLSRQEEMEGRKDVCVEERVQSSQTGLMEGRGEAGLMVEEGKGEWVGVWGPFHAIVSQGMPLKLPTVCGWGQRHSLKLDCNQIALSGPTSPSYFSRHVCGHIYTHIHCSSLCIPLTSTPSAPFTTANPFPQYHSTGHFITDPVWLMRDVRCQQGKSLITT